MCVGMASLFHAIAALAAGPTGPWVRVQQLAETLDVSRARVVSDLSEHLATGAVGTAAGHVRLAAPGHGRNELGRLTRSGDEDAEDDTTAAAGRGRTQSRAHAVKGVCVPSVGPLRGRGRTRSRACAYHPSGPFAVGGARNRGRVLTSLRAPFQSGAHAVEGVCLPAFGPLRSRGRAQPKTRASAQRKMKATKLAWRGERRTNGKSASR